MGTIFVAYGEPDHRNDVLEFAVDRAAECGQELFVYHLVETDDESADAIREEAAAVIERRAPGVSYEVSIERRSEWSDDTNVSMQKRLTNAILESDTEYEYVVMGDVERSAVDGLTHASLTEAVLDVHEIPVLLVPV